MNKLQQAQQDLVHAFGGIIHADSHIFFASRTMLDAYLAAHRTATSILPTEARTRLLAEAIRVAPSVVWRMQRQDGSYCKEWRSDEEAQARAYFAAQQVASPDVAAQYSLQHIEYFTEHGMRCNEAADLLQTLTSPTTPATPQLPKETP